jgi:hypothetical protein
MVNNITFDHITAKITLKKVYFFGVFKRYAIIIIVPSLKVVKIKTNISNFKFKECNSLDIDELLLYVKKEKYKISYTTKNSKLKIILDYYIN